MDAAGTTNPGPPPRGPARHRLRRAVLYSPLVAVLLLVVLLPFPRQWFFGPKIDGMPLCYWQDQLRLLADPKGYEGALTARILRYFGIGSSHHGAQLPSGPAVVVVAVSLVDDPNPKVRRQTSRMLAGSEGADARTALLRLLDDPDHLVRREAIEAFRFSRELPGDVMARLERMLDDPDAGCRTRAACAIGRHEKTLSPRILGVVRAALADTDHWNRWMAAHFLCGRAKEVPQLFPDVAHLAANDSAGFVRRETVAGLAAFGEAPVPVLMELTKDPDDGVRLRACHGLGRLGPRAERAMPALTERLADREEMVRDAAAEALAKVRPQGPREP